jgi:hypothetical protein
MRMLSGIMLSMISPPVSIGSCGRGAANIAAECVGGGCCGKPRLSVDEPKPGSTAGEERGRLVGVAFWIDEGETIGAGAGAGPWPGPRGS